MSKRLLCLVLLGWALLWPVRSEAASAFKQAGPMLFGEAEDFTTSDARTDTYAPKTWQVETAIPGFVGAGYVAQNKPDTGGTNGTWANAAELTYKISFSTAGTYTVWLRRYAVDGSSNSCFLGLDGTQFGGTTDNVTDGYGQWVWKKGGGTVDVTAGDHVLNIRRRERGYVIDRIVLTTDAAYTPVGEGPVETASAPNPANGQIDVTAPLFQWTAGVNAVTDDIYFGTNPNPGAAELKSKQPSAMALFFYMGVLEPGATYYWRVDTTDMAGTLHKGAVWSFTVMPVKATLPSPTDGATFVLPAPTLGWKVGQNTPTHDVYFGTDKAAVTAGNASVFKGNRAENTFVPGALDRNTTYYWRVDEIDASGTKFVGDVWTFTTTLPGLGTAKRQIWTSIPGTAVSDLFKDVNFPYAPKFTDEVTEFRTPINIGDNYGGRLSAWLHVPVAGDYTFWVASDDSSQLFLGPHPGKVKMIASVDGWTNDQEWGKYASQKSAVQTLQAGVYFIEAFWKEGGGGDNCSAAWQGPGIPRQVISGGYLEPSSDLWAVRPSPADGATGVVFTPELKWVGSAKAKAHDVYFGDSESAVAAANTKSPQYKGRLTAMSFKPGDLTLGNTYYWRVDEVNEAVPDSPWKGAVWSFKVSDSSLIDDFDSYEFAPVAPSKAPVGWWKFDGDAKDSSGNGKDGTINGAPTFVNGMSGQAIHMDGKNDFVVVGSVGISGKAARTISGWAKADTTNITDWTNVFGFTSKPDGGNGLSFDIDKIGGANQYCIHTYGWERGYLTIDLEWHHLAATFDGTTMKWYADGHLAGSENWTQSFAVNTNDNVQMGKRGHNAGGNWPGSVDDVRIYNVALSGPEIASLAGYVPNKVLSDVWKGDKVVNASLANNTAHSDGQSMKLTYNTRIVPCGGAAIAAPPYKDLTRGGANAISVWIQGAPKNYTDWLLVAVADTGGATFLATYKDMSGLSSGEWKNWTVPLKLFSANGVKTNSAAKVGVGVLAGRPGPGTFYVDDITLIKQ